MGGAQDFGIDKDGANKVIDAGLSTGGSFRNITKSGDIYKLSLSRRQPNFGILYAPTPVVPDPAFIGITLSPFVAISTTNVTINVTITR